MIRRCAILAVTGLTLALGASGAACAADGVFMAPATAGQLILQASPALDLRRGPAAPALLGLGQPELGLRPEVLALTGVSTDAAVRLRLSDTFYRQGLVIAPGPSAGAEGQGAPGLVDLVGLRLLSGGTARACVFACVGAAGIGGWLEAAPRPAL